MKEYVLRDVFFFGRDIISIGDKKVLDPFSVSVSCISFS